MTDQQDSSPGVFPLPADMRVANAAATIAELQRAVVAAADLALDASAVAQADTSTVQVLLIIDRELAAQGRKLMLKDPSPELRDVLALAGATVLLATHA